MDPTPQTDASGLPVQVPTSPSRIVSLVPSVTETLFAMGLGDRVVGVTDWCLHPAAELSTLARVGGTKNPKLDAIVALSPDLILANLEENREIDVKRLRSRGQCVWVDFPCTVEEVLRHVEWLAKLGGPVESATALRDALRAAAAANGVAPERRCFLAVWKDPWMTVGPATYAHDLLFHLGLRNVFEDSEERYPRLDLADLEARAPEIILLPDEPYAFTREDAAALRGDLASTPAARSGEIHVIDGTLAFWHGPRTVLALTNGLVPR